MSLTIWFRHGGLINTNAWNVKYQAGLEAELHTTRDITLYELFIQATYLCGFPVTSLMWRNKDEIYDVSVQNWDSIMEICPRVLELWVFGESGSQVEEDEVNEEEVYYTRWSNSRDYDPINQVLLGLSLRGGNPTEGECSNAEPTGECSNAGVPVGGAEAEEVGGSRDSNSEDSDNESDPNSDLEAESETALEETRSNYQGPDDYHEEWISGDWEKGLECNDWAVHASSSFNAPDFVKGDCFPNKRNLQQHVKEWHIKNARQFKTAKSTQWLIVFKCLDDSCSWKLRATKDTIMLNWSITKLGPVHSCQNIQPIQQHRQLDCRLIFHVIYPFVKKNKGMTIEELQQVVKDNYAMEPTYRKVWYAKQNVIEELYGTHEEAFERLPLLMATQSHYNPGTVFEYEFKGTDDQGRSKFDKWFWAYAPSIQGFPHCRPLISVDGTHLYGKFKGKLLVAVAYDANNHIFPLAFTLCDNESTETWTWFLQRLRKYVTKDARQVCIISDRHKGILAAVRDVFPAPHGVHRFCARHLASNFNTHFKNRKLKKKFEKLIWTTNKMQFRDSLQRFKTAKEGKFKDFIDGCGHISTWSLSHDGGHRYGVMTTNHSEVFNNVLKKARSLPVTALLKTTFSRMNKYWVNRSQEGLREAYKGNIFLDKIVALLKDADEKSGHFTASPYIYGVRYGVETREGETYVVDLKEKNCECGEWTLYGWPCSHAMCAIKKVNGAIESFVDPHFKVQYYILTYAHPFQPLRRDHEEELWTGPTVTFDPVMMVTGKGGKGRKKERIRNEMDTSKQPKKKTCSRCRQPGHNRKTCKAPS